MGKKLSSPDKCLANCDLFGRHAEYFESNIVPLWQAVYDSLVSRARIPKGASVLDAGTGTGEVALRLSPLVGPRGRVVAIDVQDEMLRIGRRKSRTLGLGNLKFRQMSMEELDLPESAFDCVVGNYSLCCCLDYEQALSECFRVLKPGGRLTYNHGGPSDPVESEIIFRVFEKYKKAIPSKRLLEIRRSDAAQTEAVEKYRDPLVTLAALRNAGFSDVEASIVPRTIRYPNAAGYVDRMLAYDWRSEAEEMKEADIRRLRKVAIGSLAPLSKGPGFAVEDETMYFTGLKG